MYSSSREEHHRLDAPLTPGLFFVLVLRFKLGTERGGGKHSAGEGRGGAACTDTDR